jgi:hypothetical protein
MNVSGYEIKIELIDIKPKIWRKMVAPRGLTFAEFQIMLNLGMGWHNDHLYEFEFPKLKTWVTNNEEAMGEYDPDFFEEMRKRGFPMDEKKFMSAYETKIDDFLSVGSKFWYAYDLGDYWEHNIRVIKVVEDYDLDCATVTGYSGNCPPEDCGGAYGYENFLSIIGDPQNREYKRITKWAKERGYKDYDMAEANERLKNWRKYLD